MARYDVFIISKSEVEIEGNWVVKAKSKKKAKKKFAKMEIAKNYEVVSVKKHKKTAGE